MTSVPPLTDFGVRFPNDPQREAELNARKVVIDRINQQIVTCYRVIEITDENGHRRIVPEIMYGGIWRRNI